MPVWIATLNIFKNKMGSKSIKSQQKTATEMGGKRGTGIKMHRSGQEQSASWKWLGAVMAKVREKGVSD